MSVLPCHISAGGRFTSLLGESLLWSISPRVYQGAEDYVGDVSLSFTRVDFHACRDSVSVTLPPEVAQEIAVGMAKALTDLNEMLREARSR